MIESTVTKTLDSLTKEVEIYNVKSFQSEKCHYSKKGYPFCQCNDCLDAITELDGFRKDCIYSYQGKKVTIRSFCPLDSCKDIFIQGKDEKGFWAAGYCQWLTVKEAREELSFVSVVEQCPEMPDANMSVHSNSSPDSRLRVGGSLDNSASNQKENKLE